MRVLTPPSGACLSSMMRVLTTSNGVVSPAAMAPATLPARPACQVGMALVVWPLAFQDDWAMESLRYSYRGN